ncbi:flavodoxin [Vibrio sp. MACH09]|uniref:flavodoxin n=1 Tax=Vibrio sp. MACH09 TaxID=3025122 RepID=UPI0027912274|nr:flavodoxin [Vibrio sp. MACH09]GLO63510.1 flavodoxin [Vibrio sp. MACH09]
MKKIGVFFGSNSGATKTVAELIATKFEIQAQDIADTDVEDFEQYDLIILGTPTVNQGELQSDWDYVLDEIEDIDLSSTRVALFGLGDQSEYADTFVDALADLAEVCTDAGATIIGHWPSNGYQHTESRSENDGEFIGLALDMDRQPSLTKERVDLWTSLLKTKLA